MHSELILQWFIGLAVALAFQVHWSRTGLPQHLWNLLRLRPQVFTKDDLVRESLRFGAWGDLWICPICSSHYIALAVLAGWARWEVLVIGFFTWAGVAGWLTGIAPIHRGVAQGATVAAHNAKKSNQIPIPTRTTPSQEAMAQVLRIISEMQGTDGVVRKVSPAWTRLQVELARPSRPEFAAIAQQYQAAIAAATGPDGKCPDCERGGILRTHYALLIDAGFRPDP